MLINLLESEWIWFPFFRKTKFKALGAAMHFFETIMVGAPPFH
jgi:hypothetical protein